jgi:hypothetical protein
MSGPTFPPICSACGKELLRADMVGVGYDRHPHCPHGTTSIAYRRAGTVTPQGGRSARLDVASRRSTGKPRVAMCDAFASSESWPRCVAPFAVRCVVYAPRCRGMHEESRTYGRHTYHYRRSFADLRPWHRACIDPLSRCRHDRPGRIARTHTYAVPRQGRGSPGSLEKRPTWGVRR